MRTTKFSSMTSLKETSYFNTLEQMVWTNECCILPLMKSSDYSKQLLLYMSLNSLRNVIFGSVKFQISNFKLDRTIRNDSLNSGIVISSLAQLSKVLKPITNFSRTVTLLSKFKFKLFEKIMVLLHKPIHYTVFYFSNDID
jgi:hypothetical protein